MTIFAPRPYLCDICREPFPTRLGTIMYDCRVPPGTAWGCLCLACFQSHRCKTGLGLGQRYIQDEKLNFILDKETSK